jgi:hypothetical protein
MGGKGNTILEYKKEILAEKKSPGHNFCPGECYNRMDIE